MVILELMMNELQIWTLSLGALIGLYGLATLAMPARISVTQLSFPRDKWLGYILSTVALTWAGVLLYKLPLEFLIPYRRYFPIVIGLSIPFAWYAMPDLLAARALGGVMVLIPAPVLQLARVHPSDWRLLVVILMYIMAVAGMTFIMAPYLLRDLLGAISKTKGRVRFCGMIRSILGAMLIWVALAIFA